MASQFGYETGEGLAVAVGRKEGFSPIDLRQALQLMPGLGVMKGNGPILATPILRPNAASRTDDADTFVFAGFDGVHGRVVSRALTGRIGAWRGRIIGDAR